VTLMADSVEPALIPASFRAYRTRGVAPYADGPYAWDRAETDSFPRRLAGIDVDASSPARADVLDTERFDATPAQWPAWRAERVRLCHEGKARGWPKVYCSIAPGDGYGVQAVAEACRSAGQALPDRWWSAWYATPGGQPPTAEDVVSQILASAGVRLAVGTIWACQYLAGVSYDLSVVYQDPEWQ
jgi:hypothetical protein